MRAISCTAALALACATGVVAAPPATLRAGALGVRIEPDPWRIVFEDVASGRIVLSEAAGGSPALPGPVGFRTAAGWVHATRLVSARRAGRRLLAVADTDDPQQRQLAVTLARDANGIVAVVARVRGETADVEALGTAFVAEPDERFFGFGERADTLEHRGRVVESYVSDGPYQEEERPIVGQLVPAPGFRERDDATYYPVPWLLSSRGIGVLVDDDEVSYFDLGAAAPRQWSIEVEGAPRGWPARGASDALALRVFAGPTPADVLARFTARTGRQPPPAAPWIFGPWIQLGGSLGDRLAELATLRAAGAPVSVVQTYTHYLPCGSHVGQRESERAMVAAFHDAGAAVTTYFNPMICESYEPRFSQAAAAGALTRQADGSPYVYDYTGTSIFRVGQFDLSTRAGRRVYAELLAEAVEDGHDGWMEDFGEYTPLDAVDASGRTGAAYHDAYPVDYHCGAWAFARRAPRPIVRFQRSGWTGAARCAQVVWNGDPSTTWGFDGLTSALWGGLGMGLSGVAFWGSDVGGFFALGDRALTPELLMRWVQLGAVSGVMRTQHNGFAFPAKERPQIYDPDQLANWTRYARLRTQLYPYLAAAAADYARRGLPIMRHLLLSYPEDPAAVARDDELLFGPDLLAAPVLAPGATTRDAYLPAGGWVDLWRAGAWDSAAGAFVLGTASVLAGGGSVTVPAPADELPLFVRAGAVLPLLPADVDTLAPYGGRTQGLVRLADAADRLALLAFPRGDTTARLFAGRERLRSIERPDGWELVLRGRRRTYDLQASLATLAHPFAACRVAWNGRPLAAGAWSYDAETAVLRARFTGRTGRLRVRACRGG